MTLQTVAPIGTWSSLYTFILVFILALRRVPGLSVIIMDREAKQHHVKCKLTYVGMCPGKQQPYQGFMCLLTETSLDR